MNFNVIFTLLFLVGTNVNAMESPEGLEPRTKKGKLESSQKPRVKYRVRKGESRIRVSSWHLKTSAFVEAVAEGQVEEAKALAESMRLERLPHNIFLEDEQEDPSNAFALAALQGDEAMVLWLAPMRKPGCRPECPSPLESAIKLQRFDCLREVIELAARHPDLRKKLLDNRLFITEFERAAQNGNEKVVSIMLEAAHTHPELADWFFPDRSQDYPTPRTAFHLAVAGLHHKVVEMLLKSPFSDRFYVNVGAIDWPDNDYSERGLPPRRCLMRHLITRFRPQFAEIVFVNNRTLQRFVDTLLNCDVSAFRQLMINGALANEHYLLFDLRDLFKFLAATSTDETLRKFYRNFTVFLSELAELRNEVDSNDFRQAVRGCVVHDFMDGADQPINQNRIDILVNIRLQTALGMLQDLPLLFDAFVRASRLDFLRAFIGDSADIVNFCVNRLPPKK